MISKDSKGLALEQFTTFSYIYVIGIIFIHFIIIIIIHRLTSAPFTLVSFYFFQVPYGSAFRSSEYDRNSRFNVDSFCNLIHNAFPKAVQDGRFILIEPDDQAGYSDTHVPMTIAPPTDFIQRLGIPKLKVPKLRIPSLTVPNLKEQPGPYNPPRIGSPSIVSSIMKPGEVSSAERMEKFKKGVQKMLHVVKVLGQIDQYLSERMRIIVDKLTKTFAE